MGSVIARKQWAPRPCGPTGLLRASLRFGPGFAGSASRPAHPWRDRVASWCSNLTAPQARLSRCCAFGAEVETHIAGEGTPLSTVSDRSVAGGDSAPEQAGRFATSSASGHAGDTAYLAPGPFVDIGVHHDGLNHLSELADRFVRFLSVTAPAAGVDT